MIALQPVGFVRSPRTEPLDDNWGGMVASIELDPARFTAEAVVGLAEFSHLEVVYHFHLVPETKIETGARHPRNNPDWPRAGIFAQRGKNRPNRLGVSRCRLLSVEGTTLVVEGLDAIEGTPVLDVKPWMQEFGPRGEVVQPQWSSELMADYY
jgi:tRNA (adenine37-N6)-methyltransferase